jgi:hypothetical protein
MGRKGKGNTRAQLKWRYPYRIMTSSFIFCKNKNLVLWLQVDYFASQIS